MGKQIIPMENPRNLPVSQGIRVGDFLFIAGQGPHDRKTGKLFAKGITEQARQTLENLKSVVEAAGLSMDSIVRVGVFLKRSKDFAKMNEVYREYFPSNQPVRATVVTGLAFDSMLIEIDAIAYAG